MQQSRPALAEFSTDDDARARTPYEARARDSDEEDPDSEHDAIGLVWRLPAIEQ